LTIVDYGAESIAWVSHSAVILDVQKLFDHFQSTWNTILLNKFEENRNKSDQDNNVIWRSTRYSGFTQTLFMLIPNCSLQGCWG